MWHFWELKFNQEEALGSLATSALAGAEQQRAQIRAGTEKASGVQCEAHSASVISKITWLRAGKVAGELWDVPSLPEQPEMQL